MWDPVTRFDDDWMAAHLHDDVVEFGRSGRRYDRRAILDVTPRPSTADPAGVRVDLVADDVALLTCRSTFRVDGDPDEHPNRSSMWVRTSEVWQLRSHQGTPVGSDAASG